MEYNTVDIFIKIIQKRFKLPVDDIQKTINDFKSDKMLQNYISWFRLETNLKILITNTKKNMKSIITIWLFIQEAVLISIPNTESDKKTFYSLLFEILKTTTEITELKISDLGFPNWLKEFAEAKSCGLWAPLKKEIQELEDDTIFRSVKGIKNKSWIDVKSSISNDIVFWGNENLLDLSNYKPQKKSKKANQTTEAMGIWKIRLYPNRFQKEKLNKMFQANRWAWNIIIEKAQDGLYSGNSDFKKSLRKFVIKKNISDALEIKSVPEECFDSAFRDVYKARDANFAKSKARKLATGSGYQLKKLRFKSKKDASQSIEIRSRSIKTGKKSISMFSAFFEKQGSIKIKAKLPEINHSCRLQKTNSKFFLLIPVDKTCQSSQIQATCAIDPGVRSMLTIYDPDGFIHEIGTNPEWITKKQNAISAMQSILTKETSSRKRERLKRRIKNTFEKITNRIADAHHKISKWISETYKKVLLPVFESQKMVSNNTLSKKTKTQLMSWSHYKFKELLRYKMKSRGGKLLDCTEEYTSKTCSACGRLNHALKGSKTFACGFSDCKSEMDRDANAAKNIFVKNYKLLLD